MQEREKLSSIDMNVYLSNLRRNPRFKEDVVKLVEQDLQYGLTIEETELYSTKKWNLAQMEIYSKCLKNGYSQEVTACIAKEGLTAEQMAVALEFYEKGVTVDTIAKVTDDNGRTAFMMKKMFQNFMEDVPKAAEAAKKEGAYAEQLLEQVKVVVEKIEFQEKRYDALNKKLKEIQMEQRDKKEQENLLNKISEMEQTVEKQQNELNDARAAVVRLRNEKDDIKKENETLEQQVAQLRKEAEERAMAEKEREQKAEEKLEKEVQKPETEEKEAEEKSTAETEKMEILNYPWDGYSVAVLDGNGKVVSVMPAERMECKKEKPALTALFSRLVFKKKTDIVKLVVEKNLEAKQLMQVRSAIEKGLSEEQILVLINNQIPAEQMKEIINIAVYENKQKQEG